MPAPPFQNIPANIRTPGFYFELSANLANTNQQNQVSLLIGQMTAAGSAAPNVPVICGGVGDAIAKAGAGSMLALMAAAYMNADDEGEVWLLPLQDAGGAVAATGSILFAGPATAAGALSLYVASCAGAPGLPQKISVPVTLGMTAAQVATAAAAAINAAPNMPVSASAANATVTLTALNKGAAAGDIDIRLNYLGSTGGEATPAGLTATVTAMSGGATNPVLTTALGNLSDHGFDFIAQPYTDSTSLAAMTTFLSDRTGRWSWQAQLFGHAFGALRATYGAATTFGATVNDQHSTVLPFYDSPSPGFVWAAAVTGAAAASLRSDPALPLQTVPIPGVLAPPIASRFNQPLRNALLFAGMSTFKVDRVGNVSIDSLITTYQTNASGQADNSYLQVETMFTLMAYLRARILLISSTYARMKVVANGTRIPPGSNFITPNLFRAGLIAAYQALCPAIVQDPADYAAGLVVTQNLQNPGRLDILDDPILTGGLRIVALLAQFQLEPPASAAAAA